MAYVLSLRPHSPLKRSFSDNPYLNSYSPLKDSSLLRPLNDIATRNASACSLYSIGSSRAGDRLRVNENTPPLASQSLLDLTPERDDIKSGIVHDGDEPRKRPCRPDRPPLSFSRIAVPSNPYSKLSKHVQRVVEPSSSTESYPEITSINDDEIEEPEMLSFYEPTQVSLPETASSDTGASEPQEEQGGTTPPIAISSQPFRRWMSTLRRRHAHRRKEHMADVPRMSFDTLDHDFGVAPLRLPESMSRTSESMSSSMGCVTAVKSASITIAGTSIAPRSDAGLHSKRYGNRSSHYSEARKSGESHRGALCPIIDESAWLRSLHRRKVIEELVASEENYVADLKVLINVRRPLIDLALC